MSGDPLGLAPPHPLTPYPPLIINACLTGMIPRKADTPHVPVTHDEIVEDALACVEAGATILHLHARDENEDPSPDPERYAKLFEAIRAEAPRIVLCATTSGRTWNEFEKRSAVLELEGSARPDMASLTLSSLNFPRQASINTPEMITRLATRMKERGVKPELEAFDPGMINALKVLASKGVIEPPFYVNLLLGSVFSAQGRVHDLAYLESQLPRECVWAGAGIGAFQLPINAASIVMGGHVRVGLEDNTWFDTGRTRHATNRDLVERVVRIAGELGRVIASPDETRALIGLES